MVLTTAIVFYDETHKYMELQIRLNSRFPATAATIRGLRDLGFDGKHHKHNGLIVKSPDT